LSKGLISEEECGEYEIDTSKEGWNFRSSENFA
jgi:hypothetical protein